MAITKRYLRATWTGCVVAGLLGCANVVPALPPDVAAQETVVVGHVVTVLMGPTTRIYTPELRFFELFHLLSQERFRVQIKSDDSWFVVAVPPGTYELTRIMVNEGAFQEAAGLNMTFQVAEGQINYVGTWRLGVEVPQYERMLLVSAVSEDEDVVRKVLSAYPQTRSRPLLTELPAPSVAEDRLYEVPPYPRVWWFRRHQTS